MTKLSVNINKIATLRNARGGNRPNVVQTAIDCERFGAQGITVHPRPDERHITYQDVLDLKKVVKTEFNIEGYPDSRYIDIISRVKPDQATLVPDPPQVITSNTGWDTVKNSVFLTEVVSKLKNICGRVSIFVDPKLEMVKGAAQSGADRIELYTEPYASRYPKNQEEAVESYVNAAAEAQKQDLGINAGHDLDLGNLKYLKERIPFLDEVSIGHALICDAIYLGLENTIQLYMRQLKD